MRTPTNTLALLIAALPLAAQESAGDAAGRLDVANRKMLWLAFGLYALVLGAYLLWSDARLRRLEKKTGA